MSQNIYMSAMASAGDGTQTNEMSGRETRSKSVRDKWYLSYLMTRNDSDNNENNVTRLNSINLEADRPVQTFRSINEYYDASDRKILLILIAAFRILLLGLLVGTIIAILCSLGIIVKGTQGDYCFNDYLCNETRLLTCINSTCSCDTNSYFSQSLSTCVLVFTNATTRTTTKSTTATASTTSKTTQSTSATTTAATTINSLYNLFTKPALSTSSVTTYGSSFTNQFQTPFGITDVFTNGRLLYYIADSIVNLTIILNSDLSYSSSVAGTPAKYVETNSNTNDVYLTSPSIELFKINSISLQKTMNLTNCRSPSNCSFEGMYSDKSKNYLYVCDPALTLIRIYSQTTFAQVGLFNLSGYTPNCITSWNNYFYVCSNDSIVVLRSNGSVLYVYPNVCNNGDKITCLTVDNYGYLALPCPTSKKLELFSIANVNLTYLSGIDVLGSSPNCLTYDSLGRLAVTSLGRVTLYY